MPSTPGDLSLAMVAKVVPLSAHRITEELVAVLFLSLGLCAVLWGAVAGGLGRVVVAL